MEDSIKHHMISDVEVGSFLSSGIDSSYIVSLAKPDKTYTVGYDVARYDESNYAKDLANKLGIQNKQKIISEEEYMEVLNKVLYHMDEPASDPAIVALYFVSNLASQDVKVVLNDLHSHENGLSDEEVKRRLKEYGPNILEEGKKRTKLSIFLKQFQNLMEYMRSAKIK